LINPGEAGQHFDRFQHSPLRHLRSLHTHEIQRVQNMCLCAPTKCVSFIQGLNMNRLQLSAKTLKPAKSPVDRVDMARLHCEEKGIHPFAMFAPMDYESNYAYPLIVWLHGPNDDERQLQQIMPLLSMRNYVAVGPRGTQVRKGRDGYSWGQSPTSVALAEQSVFDSIEAAMGRYHIAPRRIFLAGLEGGGTLAYRIVARSPDRFAGILSIGGSFPEDGQPLARLSDLRRVPLFVAHGRDSQLYPVEKLCDDLRLMHSAGLSITLRQYSCGDELNTQMLHDMDVWMMEIVNGQASQPRPPFVETA
jgi:phospholipase/carboxylesterase